MSTQDGIDLNEVARDISVREIPFSSRQAKRGYAEPTGTYRKAKTTGEPVRVVTTKVKRDEILRLLLINKTTREIASEVKLSVGTVRDYIREEEFQTELRSISEPIWRRVDEELMLTKLSKTQQINSMGDRALERIRDLLESDDEKVVAKVAADILDRNPETSRHHHVENKSLSITLSAEDLMHAAKAAAEIDAASSFVPRSKDIDGVREGLSDGA